MAVAGILRANAAAAVTERPVLDSDGRSFHFVKQQHIPDAFFDAVAALRDNTRPNTGPGHGRHLGSVPILVAQIWSKECGFPVGTKGWLDYARTKLKSNEWSKLKVHGL